QLLPIRRPAPPIRPLFVEQLEDRCLLSGGSGVSFPGAILLDPTRDLPRLSVGAVAAPPELPAERHSPTASASPQAAQVQGFYRAYLHQKPSAADLKRALRFLAGGGTLEQLQA